MDRRRHYTGLNGFAFRVFSFFSSGSDQSVLAGKRAGSAAGDDAAIAHKAGRHLQEDSQPAAHPRAGRHVLQQLVGREAAATTSSENRVLAHIVLRTHTHSRIIMICILIFFY